MSSYGYEKNTTPFLTELLDKSTIYSHAKSPGIHSAASHVSMFTGFHVEEHGVVEYTTYIDTDKTIWAELSSSFDYSTALITPNHKIANTTNLQEPFDYVYCPVRTASSRLFMDAYHPADSENTGVLGNFRECIGSDNPGKSFLNCLHSLENRTVRRFKSKFKGHSDLKPQGDIFVKEFLDWQGNQEGKWAACLNLMDAHYPYNPKSQHDIWGNRRLHEIQTQHWPTSGDLFLGRGWERRKAVEPLYNGCIRQADQLVKNIIHELRRRNDFDNTLVIITSDHGEGFGEHSRLVPGVRIRDHRYGIHEALTHVPLIVKYPNQTKGRIVDKVVSLTTLPDVLRQENVTPEDNDAFITDEKVLSSTFRLTNKDINHFKSNYSELKDLNFENYAGPWRAVYENKDDVIYKHMQKGNNKMTLEIDPSNNEYSIRKNCINQVEKAYSELSNVKLKKDSVRDIDPDIKNRLQNLGYRV